MYRSWKLLRKQSIPILISIMIRAHMPSWNTGHRIKRKLNIQVDCVNYRSRTWTRGFEFMTFERLHPDFCCFNSVSKLRIVFGPSKPPENTGIKQNHLWCPNRRSSDLIGGFRWQGQKDSNPQQRFWRPTCYHYTMPLRWPPLRTNYIIP